MSLVTPKLGLTKPAGIEQFNLATYNTNLDLIDAGVLTQDTERKKVRYSELTGGSINYPLSNPTWGVGTITVDGTRNFNNTFVLPNASDQVKILETGLYYYSWQLNTTSPPPDAEMIIANTTSGLNVATDGLKRVTTWGPICQGIAYASVNDLINFYTINRQGAFSGVTRIKVARIHG